jgi:membrane protein
MNTLNQAYHVTERRSWWRVRLTAILLTASLAAFVLISFALVTAGPAVAEMIASTVGLGPIFVWSWKILQWPVIPGLAMLIGAVLNAVIEHASPLGNDSGERVPPADML